MDRSGGMRGAVIHPLRPVYDDFIMGDLLLAWHKLLGAAYREPWRGYGMPSTLEAEQALGEALRRYRDHATGVRCHELPPP